MPEYKYLLRYNLQLFANDDKTEEPTAKKIEDTRKEGQVAKSTEISNAFALLFTFLTMKIMMSFISGRLLGSFHTFWRLCSGIAQYYRKPGQSGSAVRNTVATY